VIGQRVVYNDGGQVDRCGDHEINRILLDNPMLYNQPDANYINRDLKRTGRLLYVHVAMKTGVQHKKMLDLDQNLVFNSQCIISKKEVCNGRPTH